MDRAAAAAKGLLAGILQPFEQESSIGAAA
jgi:hypothetical protein